MPGHYLSIDFIAASIDMPLTAGIDINVNINAGISIDIDTDTDTDRIPGQP
ncbi:MAG: hypothetical protein ACRYGK_04305 [Janthinobacterium lividum]